MHPKDTEINAHLVNQSDAFWKPGHIIGSTPVMLGSSAAAYVFGRMTGRSRLQHLGMDEIEATLLAEGFTQGIKVAVRRERPPQTDGQQSDTYSFPSGHATITFAAATVLQQHLGYRAAIPTYPVASYVAMSRLHDNRHYASDVVFGAAHGNRDRAFGHLPWAQLLRIAHASAGWWRNPDRARSAERAARRFGCLSRLDVVQLRDVDADDAGRRRQEQ